MATNGSMLAKARRVSNQHSQSTAPIPTPPPSASPGLPAPPSPCCSPSRPLTPASPRRLLMSDQLPSGRHTAAVQVQKLTLNSCFQLLKRLCRVCSSVSGSIPAAAVSCSFTSRMNARSSSNRPLLRSNSSYTSHHIDCLLPQALTTSEVM